VKKSLYILLPCLLFGLALPLAAQVDRANLNGTVTDASNSVVPMTSVKAVSVDTGLQREAHTGPAGTYEIPSLPVGTYTVTFLKDGFRPLTVKSIILMNGQSRTVDGRLEVGATSDAVQVIAAAEVVNRSDAEVGAVVESAQINAIPLSGRNWATLMVLAPGAVNYGDGSQRSIRFNNHSIDDTNYKFDGIDATGVQEQAQKTTTRLQISPEAIEEFRVSTSNYTVENGSNGGGQVNVVTKSGTNSYHGSAYEYVRNNIFDSRSPFDGSSIPPFRLNQFGASLGGPVIKNKFFFFMNYEGIQQTLGATYVSQIPSVAYANQVQATSPVLMPLIKAFGDFSAAQRVSLGPNVDQVSAAKSALTQENSGLIRMDYHISDKSTAYIRYNTDNSNADSPGDAIGSHGLVTDNTHNLVLQYQTVLSPTLINEAKFGLNRANYHSWGYGTAPIELSTASFSSLSDTSLDSEVGTTFSYIDSLTKTMGRHTFKVGVDVRRIRLNNSGNTLTTSSVAYLTDADFINNKANSGGYLQGEGIVGTRHTAYAGYGQDEFKVSQSLTLNLGLRYDYFSVPYEIKNRSVVVDLVNCGGYCPKGTPYYSPNYLQFGPRAGLAWAPQAMHGNTVFRAGWGIYYGMNQNDDFSDPAESAVPRYAIQSTGGLQLTYPILPFIVPSSAPQAPKAIARDRKEMYYENWNFNVQQKLPANFLLQVGYIGGEGHHLWDKITTNLLNPVTQQRYNPAFAAFGVKENNSNNNENALQVSLNRRLTRGWFWQSQYMWSHGITDSSGGAGDASAFQNQACRACDRSNSPYDVRHNFVTTSVYQLPLGKGRQFLTNGGLSDKILGGWELSGLFTARTGLPVNITMKPKTTPLDGNTSGQRPNYVGGSIYADPQVVSATIDGWFNPNAFAYPAPGTYGNLGRNNAFGPGMYQIDGSLHKQFALSERFRMDLRGEAFNLFNHPEYKIPASTWTTASSFGHITGILNTGAVGTGTPRRFQFALRLQF
jgi:Carboxypeptidase regulatory-like domain/TonB dependent receptor